MLNLFYSRQVTAGVGKQEVNKKVLFDRRLCTSSTKQYRERYIVIVTASCNM